MKRIKQNNKSGESTSSKQVQSWTVRDSGPCRNRITNMMHYYGVSLLVLSLGLLSLPLFFGSSNVSAAQSSLTLTIDDTTIDMNVAPTFAGNFSKSNASTITAKTDNSTGYTLSIAAGDNNTETYNQLKGTGSNNVGTSISSISSATTEAQFKALSGTAYNNMWGYLPSKYCTGDTSDTCNANSDFLPSPTKDGSTIDITSTANTVDSTTGQVVVNEYELTIGARVDSTTKLGSYSNTFVVSLVSNAVPYSITYYDNVIGDMPTDVATTTLDNTVKISGNIPTKNGYTFIGWCTVAPTLNADGKDTCSGTTYAAGSSFGINQQGTNNNLVLYAMWQKTTYTIADATYMQDVNSCPSSLPTEKIYSLIDKRDNKTYLVAKLKDGKCWMTKNLDLAGGTILTPDTSDVASNYTLPASSATGFHEDAGYYVYNSNRNDSSYCSSAPGCYSYYSWGVATVGSGASFTTDGTDAPYSICPKGWRLPTSRSTVLGNSDFYRLAVAYGMDSGVVAQSNNVKFYENAGSNVDAPKFVTAGYYFDSTLMWMTDGLYWSSTVGNGAYEARFLRFTSTSTNSYVRTNDGAPRGDGFSVRCLLR